MKAKKQKAKRAVKTGSLAISPWWRDAMEHPEVPLALLARVHQDVLIILLSNMKHIKVPLTAFMNSALVLPDFDDLSIDDWGHTIVFGLYEAAVNCLIEEYPYA